MSARVLANTITNGESVLRYAVLVLPLLFAGYVGAQEPEAAQPSEQVAPVTEETQAVPPSESAQPAVGEEASQSAAADSDVAPTPSDSSQPSGRSRNTPPKGYHMVVKNGQPFYCTGEPALGSRLKARTTCMSPEQYERSQTETKEKLREKQNQGWLKGG